MIRGSSNQMIALVSEMKEIDREEGSSVVMGGEHQMGWEIKDLETHC